MKSILWKSLSVTFGLASVLYAAAPAGKAAPDFTLPATDGKSYKLSDHKGKYIVLEWYNTGCPFVRKHYDGSNMQSLQDKYTKAGVIWLSINSSAKGKEGYFDAKGAEEDRVKNNSKATAMLLDPEGKVGRLYGAKTTPHMFVIDPQGVVVYAGAIDDKNSADSADIATSKNYVSAALDSALAGQPVATKETKPYGCSVKYAK